MNNPIRQINKWGYFGPCDGCRREIEGEPVTYFEITVNEQGGHRHYCHLACLYSHEDLS